MEKKIRLYDILNDNINEVTWQVKASCWCGLPFMLIVGIIYIPFGILNALIESRVKKICRNFKRR